MADTMVQTKQKLAELRARAGIARPTTFRCSTRALRMLLSAAPVGSVASMEYRDGALKVKFKPGVADNPALQNTLRSAALQQGLADPLRSRRLGARHGGGRRDGSARLFWAERVPRERAILLEPAAAF